MKTSLNTPSNKITCPPFIKSIVWEGLCDYASLLWEDHEKGQTLKHSVTITCPEFYAMLCDESGKCIVPYELISWELDSYLANEVELLNCDALESRDEGDLNNALVLLEQAVGTDPLSYNSYLNRALIKYELGNVNGALDDFLLATIVNKKDALVYVNRAVLYFDLGYSETALIDLNMALLINPKSADAYYNRSIIRLKESSLECALLDITKAIELDATNGAFWQQMARVYAAMGNADKALDVLNFLLDKDANNAEVVYLRGLIKIQQIGDTVGGKQDLLQANQLGQKDAFIAYQRLLSNGYLDSFAA